MSAVFAYILPALHVAACIFLIVVVLLQTGKGADMGAVLGGGSQTLFGASGAGNLLTKLTTGMAITFMATSLLIAIGQRQTPSSTLLDRLPETEAAEPAPLPTPAPAEPAAQAPAAAPAAEGQAAADAAPAAPATAPAEPSAAPATPTAPPSDAPAAAAPSTPDAKPVEAPAPAAP
jgi:preprotein translocase subunit SecG